MCKRLSWLEIDLDCFRALHVFVPMCSSLFVFVRDGSSLVDEGSTLLSPPPCLSEDVETLPELTIRYVSRRKLRVSGLDRPCPQRGEYPDSRSRGLQKLAADFGMACGAIAKGLGKGGGDPRKAYDKAAAILVEYLKGAELDPIGSDSYGA